MGWLTDELRQKIRKVFEPRYKRKLTDRETEEIGENLASLLKVFLRTRAIKK